MNTAKPTKTVSKLSLQRKSSSRKKTPAKSLAGLADRRAMIAEAAYYRAEKRSFRPGLEEQDWLEAEQEIDTTLTPS